MRMLLLDLCYMLAALAYVPELLAGKHRQGVAQRCGCYDEQVRQRLRAHPVIWLHAVSVGEVKAGAALLVALRRLYPDHQIVITTVTPTGQTVARQVAAAADTVLYVPYDFSFAVRRAFDALRPRLLLLMETELWPNLLTVARQRNIPVVVVNGRISAVSFKRYRIIKPLLRPLLAGIRAWCMQSAPDAERVLRLGACPERIYCTGNIKFDAVAAAGAPADLRMPAGALVWVCGSTHDGEEAQLAGVFQRLRPDYPALRLIIAPRHPPRAAAVAARCRQVGLPVFCWSRYAADTVALPAGAVLVIDHIGLLLSLYAAADIVFVGGSLVAHGGQNPIEPALCAKPVLFGPHMFNFVDVAALFLEAGGAARVQDAAELESRLRVLLSDAAARRRMAEAALSVVSRQRGVVERIAARIAQVYTAA